MAGLGTTEILIILAVVLLLFGSAKLPTLARSLGKSARILKAETKGLHDDDDGDEDSRSAKAAPAAQNPPAREHGDGSQQARGALGSGEPIQGVPVSDPGRVRDGG
ncbi:Sec-independent protein translocase subunit TatA [Actinomadura livida]|uniref:Sec-independent protein translocase protein TatA n=1 Tax=Actinomadura livida TaxID=79909 RepID=A0A7W7IEB5_9ACTN|nr:MULTISPECIES: Sec-independent protein translocase subunit TatA [Actinomadura]MBB4775441.1 sec-independent protein translocase protein TatA [Actinomadura catellatispora]GGT90340.1 Sec-independent protein translocase protein TatA [Actinomadura livida]